MSEPFQAFLTVAGLQRAVAAVTNGARVAISHAAAGEGAYAVATDADGLATQTALVAERERVPLAGGGDVDGRQVSLSFALDGAASYWVRELGFILDDGTLFAVWSASGRTLAWKSIETPLVLGFDLALGQLPDGAVEIVVGAPPIELVLTREFAAVATAIANLQREQLRQADRIRAIDGRF